MPDRLWNRNFFLLWQGQLVSMIGGHAFFVAVMLWTKQTTNSASMIGFLMITSVVPAIILGPIGGTIADQYSRKYIMIISDIINGINLLLLGGLFYLIPNKEEYLLAFLFYITATAGILSALMRPAMLSALPDIVPHNKLQSANAIGLITLHASELITKAIGGILYRILGMPLLCILDGITFLFSAGSESFMTIPEHQLVKTDENKNLSSILRKFLAETVLGFRYLIKHKGMKEFLIVSAMINFFAVPGIMLLPFYVEDYLGVSTDWYGYLIAAAGVGSVFGFGIAGKIDLQGKTRFVAVSTAWFCIAFLTTFLGIIKDQYTAMTILIFIGMFNGFIGVNMLSVIQSRIHSSMRGRAFGILGTISGSLSPIAMGLTGIIFDLTGKNVPLIYGSIGVLLVIMGFPIAFNANYRSFIADAEHSLVEPT